MRKYTHDHIRKWIRTSDRDSRSEEEEERLPYNQREVCHVYNGGIENSPSSI